MAFEPVFKAICCAIFWQFVCMATILNCAVELLSEQAINVIFLDFCKVFAMVSSNTLLSKLEKYGFERLFCEWGIVWEFSSKEYWSMPQCPDGDSDAVPQGSVLGLAQFNIFINDTVGSKCTWAGLQMTPSWAVHLTCMRDGMPCRGTWTGVTSGSMKRPWSSIRPSAKCCTWVRAIPWYQYRLRDEWIEDLQQKDLGVLVNGKLNKNW